MKTLFTNTMVTLGLALGLGCISRAFGDLPATAPPEKTLEGVATSISQPDKTNLVKTFWSSKQSTWRTTAKCCCRTSPARVWRHYARASG